MFEVIWFASCVSREKRESFLSNSHAQLVRNESMIEFRNERRNSATEAPDGAEDVALVGDAADELSWEWCD